MQPLTVRQPEFDFPANINLMADPSDRFYSAFTVSLTFLVPHLERYLIRTMNRAKHEIKNPDVLEDMLKFSQQEANHFKRHDQLNALLKSKMSTDGLRQLEAIEAALVEDYRHFSNTRSLSFNLAYAEGFESATCATALWSFENKTFTHLGDGWRNIWEWHLAEEIEHRTVAFDAYHAFKGHYLHRIVFGTYAQWHLLSYLRRFAVCFNSEFDAAGNEKHTFKQHAGALLKRLVLTLSPFYSPHKLKISDDIGQLLDRYS